MKGSHLYALAVVGLLLSPAVTLAQDSTAPATTAPTATTPAPSTPPAGDPNEVICRRGEPVVGTRFPGPRVCHTRREWADIQYQSGKALEHIQMERSCGGENQICTGGAQPRH